jgi:hypothetical protein
VAVRADVSSAADVTALFTAADLLKGAGSAR